MKSRNEINKKKTIKLRRETDIHIIVMNKIVNPITISSENDKKK